MKKVKIIGAIMLVWLFSACDQVESVEPIEGGIVRLGLSIDHQISIKHGRVAGISNNELQVAIYDAESQQKVKYFEHFSDISDGIHLPVGNYYIRTFNLETPKAAAFDQPYYTGKSEEFGVTTGSNQSIDLMCSLANNLVSVAFDSSIFSQYDSYEVIVKAPRGELTFSSLESRVGYFEVAPLIVTAKLIRGETVSTVSRVITDVSAQTYYKLRVSESSVSVAL
ncbi:DUF4493 domain-containing protein [Limibacter armeniacum]|uniref:DUF4493 domain-containing protein n=1 Tax=Limibacter armeniacum TaxID=466084 RepID=UPI002FE62A87